MRRKLISMCFPIYNRLETFKFTFDRTIEQIKQFSDEIELIVSVNPDENVLEETLRYLDEKKKEIDILINVNEENIGIIGNTRKALELASGKYLWLIGDDDYILPGCLGRIIEAINQHPDIGWIHLEHARLTGYPERKESKVLEVTAEMFEGKGYVKDGKQAVTSAFIMMGSHVLFTSVNLYLQEAWFEVADRYKNENPQLGATFYSATKGAAYFDEGVGVVAGGEISWKDRKDISITMTFFSDLYLANGFGFSKKELDLIAKQYMRGNGLLVWFIILRMMLRGDPNGKRAFLFFYRIMPLQTVVTVVLLPIIGIFLIFRHGYKNRKRKLSCEKYKKREDADDFVVSRIENKNMIDKWLFNRIRK